MGEVRLEQLGKRFRDVVAVEDVSVTVPAGSFSVLVGPSGCGKTTTLNMIAGLELPSSGRVLIDGVEVQDLPPHRRDIGMVFQSYALYPTRTVRANIEFPLRIKRVPKSTRGPASERVAGLLGLTALLERYPRALSGGQQQRVALARAIAKAPGLFLLDEPLSNLDAKLRAAMRFELKAIQRELGATFILVTHDQAEALSLADQVIVMNQGSLQQVGSPEEVYQRPANAFVGSFVGMPEMNLVEGDIGWGRFRTGGRTIELGEADLEGRAILGVRSEDIRVERRAESGTIEATVGLSELVGPDRLVELHCPLGRLIARTSAAEILQPAEKVHIAFAHERLHLFDAESGKRRAHQREGAVVAGVDAQRRTPDPVAAASERGDAAAQRLTHAVEAPTKGGPPGMRR